MSPQEMEKSCTDIIESYRSRGFPIDMANVTLVTPHGFKKPPKFPRGYLLQVKDDGRRIWHFPAVRVLAWLRAQAGAA
jgi:hypothetical protein